MCADRPSVRFRYIGRVLRERREARGLKLDAVAHRFNRSPGWFSMVENGLSVIRVDDLTELLDFYSVTEEREREVLLQLATRGRRRVQRHAREARVSSALVDLASLEEDAEEICTYHPTAVPGLLQIESHARVLFDANQRGSAREKDELLDFRMDRQLVLSSELPPVLRSVISEAVLHIQVGGREVRRAQLHRLLTTRAKDQIRLRVLPFTQGPLLAASPAFELFKLRPAGSPTVVLLNTSVEIEFLHERELTSSYEERFEHLWINALSEQDSADLIERLLSEA